MKDDFVEQLRDRLRQPLPGIPAQEKMSPPFRRKLMSDLQDMQYRPSAVLLLLIPVPGGYYFPLIERHAYQGAHSAQVSLPGGKLDPVQDAGLREAALRECFEEIGIADISVLGELTPLHIPVSGFLVSPFVGVCRSSDPEIVPDVREVRTVLKLPVTDFLSDKILKEGTIKVAEGHQMQGPWFEVNGKQVWGATAMILSEFREVLRSIS